MKKQKLTKNNNTDRPPFLGVGGGGNLIKIICIFAAGDKLSVNVARSYVSVELMHSVMPHFLQFRLPASCIRYQSVFVCTFVSLP